MAARAKQKLKVPTNKRLTYEEWLKLPETMVRQEVVDGELINLPAPTFLHQVIVRDLGFILHQFVTQQGLGAVVFAPVDVIVRRKPKLRTRQPDLLFISNERQHIIGDRIEGGPDLVVEILSPGESRRSLADKLKDYASIGVRECWLICPDAETVEVLSLSPKGNKRLGLYGAGDVVRSKVLAGLAVPTRKIFG